MALRLTVRMTTIRLTCIAAVFVLIGTVLTEKLPCPGSDTEFHDPKTELCCNGIKPKRFTDDRLELKCCGNTTYVLGTQICCGDRFVFKKLTADGKELKCCGNSPYILHEKKKICCNNILQDRKADDDKCCGTYVIKNSYECCKDKLNRKNTKAHKRETGKKCCGTDYYNKTTHHCYRRRVLPVNYKLCGDVEYDTRKQKCCHRKLYNHSESSPHYKCCGSELFNDISYKCCQKEGHIIPSDASCCGKGYYYEDRQKCCDGTAVTFSKETELCCGKGIYDKQYQDCCGSNPYNTSSQECCRPDGDIIPKGTNDRCCSTKGYDSTKKVCCTDTNDPSGQKTSVLTKSSDKPFHDQCCSTPFLRQMESYASITHRCSLNGTIIPRADMCGDIPYNKSIDLCCDGVLDERGEEKGRSCCGVTNYYKASQICCDKQVFFKKNRQSCEEESSVFRKPNKREVPMEISLPSDQSYGVCQYCHWNQNRIIKILKSKKDICKHKALKLQVLNEISLNDKVVVMGSLRKDLFSKKVYRKKLIKEQNTRISIHLPCPCKLNTDKAILLTDIDDYSKPVRLGDSDMIIGWTKRMNNLIRRKWQDCQKDETRLAIEFVSKIKTFVDFTSTQLTKKEQLR